MARSGKKIALTTWALAVVHISPRARPEEDEYSCVIYLANIIRAFRNWSFSTWMVVIGSNGNTYVGEKVEGGSHVVVFMDGGK